MVTIQLFFNPRCCLSPVCRCAKAGKMLVFPISPCLSQWKNSFNSLFFVDHMLYILKSCQLSFQTIPQFPKLVTISSASLEQRTTLSLDNLCKLFLLPQCYPCVLSSLTKCKQSFKISRYCIPLFRGLVTYSEELLKFFPNVLEELTCFWIPFHLLTTQWRQGWS